MTLGQAIRNGFTNYAQFQGMASRSEYWWWVLFTTGVSVVLSFFDDQLGGSGSVGLLVGVWSLVTLVPSLAVAVRRLRDAGYHWALLFLLLLPIFGALVLLVLLVLPGVSTAQAREKLY